MTVAGAVTAMLSAERGGVRLGAGLIEVVAEYLVDVAQVKDVNEISMKDLKDAFAEAWANANDGGKLPACAWRPKVRDTGWAENDSLHAAAARGPPLE